MHRSSPSPRTWSLLLACLLLAACGAPAATDASAGTGSEAGAQEPAGQPTGTVTGEAAEAAPGGYEEVFAALEGLEGQERTDALVAMAEQEDGKLLWYAAMQLQLAEQVQARFAEEHGIEVELYRADKDTVLRRIMEEAAAGHEATADVVEAPALEMTRMSREGLFVPYESPVKDDLVPEAVFDDWTAERFNLFAIAWNTDLLAEGEWPTSWQDLAEDRYNGELALNRADTDWYMTLWSYWVEEQGMDPAEADRLFQEIATDALIMQGHSERAALMAAGDFSVAAPLYTHVADAAIADGAPLSYQPYADPLFIQPNGSALMAAARRPATAVLFLDWLFTEGQQLIDESGVTPAMASLQEETGVDSVLIDVEGFIDEEERWTTQWEDLMRYGEIVQQ